MGFVDDGEWDGDLLTGDFEGERDGLLCLGDLDGAPLEGDAEGERLGEIDTGARLGLSELGD